MLGIRKFLRWYFAGVALLLTQIAWLHLWQWMQPRKHLPASAELILQTLCLIGTVLSGMAWWTTRRPSPSRNVWAIAACVALLLLSCVPAFFGPFSLPVTSALLMAINIAGIIAFSRRVSVTAVPAKPTRRLPVAGDRTSRFFDLIVNVLIFASAIEALWFGFRWGNEHGLRSSGALVSMGVLFLSFFVTIALHECGHAIAAWLFDMRLLAFNAGPFRWYWRSGNWKFQFKPSAICDFKGSVAVVPVRKTQPRSSEICMFLAGPGMGLLTGTIALWATLHAAGSFYEPAWEFLACLTSLGFITGIFNLFPFRTSNGYSDGARILQLLSASPMVDVFAAASEVHATLLTSRRPGDYDIDRLRRAISVSQDGLLGLLLRCWVTLHFQDRGMVPEAREAFAVADAFLRVQPVDVPVSLHTALVLSHVTLNRDPVAARHWWERMKEKSLAEKKPLELNFDYWFARGALLFIENRLGEATEALQKAEVLGRELPHAGAYDFDREACARLQGEVAVALTHAANAISAAPQSPGSQAVPSPLSGLSPSASFA